MDRQIDGRYIGKYSIKYLGLILYIKTCFYISVFFLDLEYLRISIIFLVF